MVKLSCMLCTALAVSLLAFGSIAPDDKWRWSDDRSNILSYLMAGSQIYDIALNRPAGKPTRWLINVVISRDGRDLYTWESHHEGAFVVDGDTLVHSTHQPMATGCSISSVDLKTGKTLWTTHLTGIGPISHSRYRNRINLEVSKGLVTVYGNETGGQYIEKLDLASGKVTSNAVGQKEFKRF